MASRMERYYGGNECESRRSNKNRILYDEIQNIKTYNNIEAVATIENTNEIDITKIKDLLKNRENYNKEKRYLNTINKKNTYDEPEQILNYDDKNYDILEALSKAKNDRKIDDGSNDNLKNTQYNILKSLQLKDKDYTEDGELKKLIESITKNKKEENDEADLLDNLRSDTVVGDVNSIQTLINKEKMKLTDATNSGLDKSFYTSSLGFTNDDFEDLKSINHNIKKNNLLIKILLVFIFIAIIGVTLYFTVF